MSDFISRQVALDAIQQRADEIDSVYSAFWEGLKIAQDIVKNIPSAEPERKWIPVTEALPKNSGHDWVLGQIRETDSDYLWIPKVVEYRESSDDWFEESIGWLKKNPDHAFEVIAWMPLPEPWRGDR